MPDRQFELPIGRRLILKRQASQKCSHAICILNLPLQSNQGVTAIN